MPGVTPQQAREFTDREHGQLAMVFQFEHVVLDQDGDKWTPRTVSVSDLRDTLARWQLALADGGWNSLYLSNHDQPRVVSRFGNDAHYWYESATALATVLHLHRGTPYVYQGEELGMTNAGFTRLEQYADLESLNHAREALARGVPEAEVMRSLAVKSRDNARTPMQWDAGERAGFTTGTPWLPANPNHDVVNAEAAVADPDSVFHHYRALIELRHTDDVVVDGRFELLLPDHPSLWVYTRTRGDEVLLVLANCSSAPATIEPGLVPDLAGSQVLVPTHGPSYDLTLRPWESRVHRL
jgi:oligo-1,6-glucosidase